MTHRSCGELCCCLLTESRVLYTLVKYIAGKLGYWKVLRVPFFLIPVMPYNSAHHCVVEVENFLFVLGGEDQWNPNGNYLTVLIVAALVNWALGYYNKISEATNFKEKTFIEVIVWEVLCASVLMGAVDGGPPRQREQRTVIPSMVAEKERE